MKIANVSEAELEALLHEWWGKGKAVTTLWLYEETPTDLVMMEPSEFGLNLKPESTFGRLFGSTMEIVWRQHSHFKDYHVRMSVDMGAVKGSEQELGGGWLPIQKKESENRELLFLEESNGEQKKTRRLAIDHYTLISEKGAGSHPQLTVWVEVTNEGGNV